MNKIFQLLKSKNTEDHEIAKVLLKTADEIVIEHITNLGRYSGVRVGPHEFAPTFWERMGSEHIYYVVYKLKLISKVEEKRLCRAKKCTPKGMFYRKAKKALEYLEK